MSYLLLIFGFCIVLITISDLLVTVLSPNGSGFITGRISRFIWRSLLLLSRNGERNVLLRYAGVIILLFTVWYWVSFIWLGNTLMVFSDHGALLDKEYRSVTGFIDKLYFSAYVLSSMGNGDYVPNGNWWKLYTSLISYTGLFFITLSISYLIPVIEAVTHKRKVALSIYILGKNPEDIISRYLDSKRLKYLLVKISDLSFGLLECAQNQLAYPVIHYFHSPKRHESLPLNIACLDETLTLAECIIIKEQNKEEYQLWTQAREAVDYYLSTLSGAYINPKDDKPEHPDTSFIDDYQIEQVKDIEEHYTSYRRRRSLLLAYIQNDGWEWKDMTHNHEDIKVEGLANE